MRTLAPHSQANANKVDPGTAGGLDAAVRCNNDRAGLQVGRSPGRRNPGHLFRSSGKTSYSQREGQSCTGPGCAASRAKAQHCGRDRAERRPPHSPLPRGGPCDHGSRSVGGARLCAVICPSGRFLPGLAGGAGPFWDRPPVFSCNSVQLTHHGRTQAQPASPTFSGAPHDRPASRAAPHLGA